MLKFALLCTANMTGLQYIPLIIVKLKLTDPDKIILFGSYAYGEPSNESDLDILVVTGDNVINYSLFFIPRVIFS